MGRLPTGEELRRILACPVPAPRPLLLSSGLRMGEALKIGVGDICLDDDPPKVIVRGQFAKSGNPPHILPNGGGRPELPRDKGRVPAVRRPEDYEGPQVRQGWEALPHDAGERPQDAVQRAQEVLQDKAVLELAKIVRAADTGKPEAAPEAAGLDAIMTGISIAARDDNEAIRNAALVYDALYKNCRLERIKEDYKTELGKMDRGQRRVFLKKKLDE